MDDKQRLNLQEMIKAYDADDNTSKIRNLKHSRRIRDDVEKFVNLKKKYSRMMTFEPKKFEKLVISHCNFLWTNYTNIFNRIMKDELNLNILRKFIDTLRDIEDGTVDQHEASVKICRPVVNKIKQGEVDYYGSDCPMAGKHIENVMDSGFETVHPITMLRLAYEI